MSRLAYPRVFLRILRDMVSDRRNKLVPALWESFNVYGFVMLVTQDLANPENVFLDEFRIYVCFRPQRLQKFILRYQSSRMFNQVTQHIEGLRCKGYPVLATPQALVRRIKSE